VEQRIDALPGLAGLRLVRPAIDRSVALIEAEEAGTHSVVPDGIPDHAGVWQPGCV
jgi:hypothetical protein